MRQATSGEIYRLCGLLSTKMLRKELRRTKRWLSDEDITNKAHDMATYIIEYLQSHDEEVKSFLALLYPRMMKELYRQTWYDKHCNISIDKIAEAELQNGVE
jgi:hypothetical protein